MTCHKALELAMVVGALFPQKGDVAGVRRAEWHKADSTVVSHAQESLKSDLSLCFTWFGIVQA